MRKVIVVFVFLFALLSLFQAGVAGAHREFSELATNLLLSAFMFAILAVIAYEHLSELYDHLEVHHRDEAEKVAEAFIDRLTSDLETDKVKTKSVAKDAALQAMKADAAGQDNRKRPADNIDGVHKK